MTAYTPFLKGILAAFPILAIIAISGCITGTTGGATGPGIVITKWEPDFSYLESGQLLTLDLDVQNQGGEEAVDVEAVLTGIDLDEWDVESGSRTQEDMHDLSPANPEYNTQGETDTAQWVLEAPDLPEGIEQTYNPQIRVYYEYKTTATKPILLVNENELRRLAQSGQSLQTQAGQYSGGPLSITVTTGSQIRAPENRDPSFPITIVLENTGGGVILKKNSGRQDADQEDDYIVELSIELPSGLSMESDCSEFRSRGEVKLSGGRQRSITCDVEFNNPPDIAEQKTIQILAEYDYYIDRTTSVTVKGVDTEDVF
jgi:hypothetical protein